MNTKDYYQTILYKDGTKYSGEVKNRVPHGKGSYTNKEGAKYYGEWKNGSMDGSGVFIYKGRALEEDSYNHWSYFSDFLKIHRTLGSVSSPFDGTKYEGEWKEGKRDGQGTLTWPVWVSGFHEEYIGEWKNDKMCGYGICSYNSGSEYKGEYKDNKRHGQGTMTICMDESGCADGAKYEGEWKEGLRDGQGTLTFEDGAKYVGEWKKGERDGQGTLTWADGRKYIGQWKDDERNGNGSFTSKTGAKYIGKYLNGLPSGYGILISQDGIRLEGIFEDGSLKKQYNLSSKNFISSQLKSNKRRIEPDGGGVGYETFETLTERFESNEKILLSIYLKENRDFF